MAKAKLKLRKGDKVVVLSGKDKGKRGEILIMLRDKNKAVVQGVNVVKKHTKPSQNNAGGIIDKELPIHLSNIGIEDPKDGKPTRIGVYMRLDDRGFSLKIVDDGSGFDGTPAAKGLGFHTMKYRAKAIGAALTISSDKKGGTILSVTGEGLE